MKMKPKVAESMTKLAIGPHFKVRVWRSHDSLEEALLCKNDDLRKTAKALWLAWCTDIEKIIEAFAEMPRVSAIEILNVQGDGLVLYYEWP